MKKAIESSIASWNGQIFVATLCSKLDVLEKTCQNPDANCALYRSAVLPWVLHTSVSAEANRISNLPLLRPEHKRSRKHFLKKWQREGKHLIRLNTICCPAGPSAADTSPASQPAPASSYCTVPLLPAWPSPPAAACTGRNMDICF